MKAVSTMAFNAMGISVPEAGVIIDTKSAVTLAQLQNMGFVEVQANEESEEPKAKKAKKK